MALVTPTVVDVGSEAALATWILTTADHTGIALGPEVTSRFREVTWHARSAAWGSATAAAEGSNEDTNAYYGASKSADGGGAIAFTADAGSAAVQTAVPAFVRARLSAVGAGATVYVTAYLTRQPFSRGRVN